MLFRSAVAQRLNALTIADYIIEATSYMIEGLAENGQQVDTGVVKQQTKQKAVFAPLDLIHALSESTGLAYTTVFKIIKKIDNHAEWIKNPPRFVHEAALIIRSVD